ncbi:hypothetical protein SAMN05216553_103134 [Lentzea fradiae]|uniref:Uncharacterized protein n=1 Tax=Lentzea fradiae TaxID=200378 RepID=A0A1G7NRG2_9PSEU|nr:hypothetical protein [Lentzea fradiae]SDF75879.1 hypothetical protein SAMN05216553_103134 [Lentzea fradiae]
MAVTAVAAPSAKIAVQKGLVPASFVLAGALASLVGMSWDIQWHDDVGPDTFFTLPHLLMYSGSAFAGLASLFVVLTTTANTKRGKAVDPIVGGRAVGVLGRTFAAPVGYLISGSGAALFLMYGLWDQVWHSIYGFDAVIDSPPHIGLLLSVSITMVGTVMVFAVARDRRWGVNGLVVAAATLLMFSMVTVLGLRALPDGLVDAITVGSGFLAVAVLFAGAHVLNRRGAALAIGAVVAAVQTVLWFFSPWAAEVYADAMGLPLRDYLEGYPGMPSMIPMSLILVAVVVEVLRAAPPWVPGLVGGAVIAALAPVQNSLVQGSGFPGADKFLVTVVVGAAFGALAGMLGHRFGQMMRHLAPEKENRHA